MFDLLHNVPDVAITCDCHQFVVNSGVVGGWWSIVAKECVRKPDAVPAVGANLAKTSGALKRQPWITPGLSQIKSHLRTLYSIKTVMTASAHSCTICHLLLMVDWSPHYTTCTGWLTPGRCAVPRHPSTSRLVSKLCVMPGFHHSVAVIPLPFRRSAVVKFRCSVKIT